MFCMFNITAVLAFNVNRCVAVQLPALFKNDGKIRNKRTLYT